jgi:predicted ester cyclase
MSVEENKVTLRRIYEEIWNKGNISLVYELVSPEYHHGEVKGVEGFRQLVIDIHTAFPDFSGTLDQVIGEGDWLAYRVSHRGTLKGRLRFFEPTGKEAKWNQLYLSEFKDGKLKATVTFYDTVNFYQQLGIRPPGF